LKLKPVAPYPPVQLKGRVSGELNLMLSAYATYYRETTGRPIELWSLVVQILQQFLATDRDFQTWRRRTEPGPGAGPKPSQ
jgi:hypothetical protein